jgi:hypothetical protein
VFLPPSRSCGHAVVSAPTLYRTHQDERKDEAGRLARRLQREGGSLWVFLSEAGVEAI